VIVVSAKAYFRPLRLALFCNHENSFYAFGSAASDPVFAAADDSLDSLHPGPGQVLLTANPHSYAQDMRPEELKELLDAQPFVPVRIHMRIQSAPRRR